jgi:CheY-specific phosphatase CheX
MNQPREEPAPNPVPDLELLAALFRGVWCALTTLDLQPLAADPSRTACFEAGPTGLVHISGGWAGTVVLRLTAALGSRAASAMLGLENEEPPPEDIRDVTGEITNVLGGKLKATLPGRCQLSLPTVVEGDHHHVHLAASRSLGELWFESGGQLLAVSVWKREDAPGP